MRIVFHLFVLFASAFHTVLAAG